MPDGTRYDRRFRLKGDLELDQVLGVDIEDEDQMARRYGVDIEIYRAGQEWAQQNLI